MAMELHVLSDRSLCSTAEWQRAVDAEGYHLRLAPNVLLAAVDGFLPVWLEQEETGFECYHDDASETIALLGIENFDHKYEYALGFRWLGSRVTELQAVWMAATAYAVSTNGIIFNHEEAKVFTAQQGRTIVQDISRNLPVFEAVQEEIKRRFAVPKNG